MENDLLIFDENKYPVAWRFNSPECVLTQFEKNQLVFLESTAAKKLWNMFFPFNNLMEMPNDFFPKVNKFTLSFEQENNLESQMFFQDTLNGIETIFFFWNTSNACITSSSVFIKSWNDFFYPSDETSILVAPNNKKIIFSFEETFFISSN